jgi:glutamate-ammonia-ligase adenylyltransferase
VDIRLRPFGDSGPLVMSFPAMEDYYQFQAREWERYAMIKARVIAGGRDAADSLMAMLRPFVYRRYLDYGAFESLRDMKALISRELRRKGMMDNIKLGPGGIREIEFIGQAFQLIRGGREPDLQIRAIVPVLKRLAAMNYLPEYVIQELIGAYEFLRRVENRLQAWEDRQTHVLPTDGLARLRLARSMGFADWDGLQSVLETHRRRVQDHFDKVFAATQAEAEGDRPALSLIWQGKLDGSQAQADLEQAGFAHPRESLERLQKLRDSLACRSLSARGRQRLDRLMPLLLLAAGGVDRPDETLRRLLILLEAVARRIAYVSLLVESPIALSQLVRLSAASPWIAGLLSRYPLLLDELLDPRRLYSPLHRKELEAELDSLIESPDPEDLEHQMERLRQFAQSNILRVASADITGAIPLMVVSDFLTEIAEVVLGRVVRLAWAHLSARHGVPARVLGGKTGFAVVAYGKLGGIELGYGSDLDLVFLNGGEDHAAHTDGKRPLANDVFYTRLAQRIIHILNTQTPSGALYEVDMRLRPNGASGMLVSSLDAFDEYQRHQAWVWEHQALIRARVVAGDSAVSRRFEEIRREVLAQAREPEALRAEVTRMRARMRTELIQSTAGRFDLKQGLGGIADIEFMVQYFVLRWAHEYPDLLDFTDNVRLLEGLSRNRLLEGAAAEELANAYRAFRAAYHRNALQEQPGLVSDGMLMDERRRVAEIWRDLMEPG